MADLRLPKLPDRAPVKITISVPPELSRSLEEYVRLYAEAYGEEEPVSELIPAMLSMFLQGDRAFARHRKGGSRAA